MLSYINPCHRIEPYQVDDGERSAGVRNIRVQFQTRAEKRWPMFAPQLRDTSDQQHHHHKNYAKISKGLHLAGNSSSQRGATRAQSAALRPSTLQTLQAQSTARHRTTPYPARDAPRPASRPPPRPPPHATAAKLCCASLFRGWDPP